MEKNDEKGFVRIKSKSEKSFYFDSKILSKKECEKIIKNFKNDINQGINFIELSLVSGAYLILMVSDIDHILYVPEKIMNKKEEVEEVEENKE